MTTTPQAWPNIRPGHLHVIAVAEQNSVGLTRGSFEKHHYSQAPFSDIVERPQEQKMFTSREWKHLNTDGTAVRWLQRTSDVFMTGASASIATPASDPSICLSTI